MEALLKLIGGLFLFVLMMLSSLWITYIIWDICVLYDLTFLTQYGYKIFFGSAFIISLLSVMLKRPQKSGDEVSEVVGLWFGRQIGWLMIWGTAYLYYWIMKF